ncbi:hypothetical protein FZEAL_6427 [Fusarium zealandicum]|uniref:CCZ1/INTU/HSP4 first Longin domain-containing protein n=1 Tax=Fusarium zealandicum TaxID=1053134 RepID=A0A8H4UHT3_9HYPO|nr:hypothetical protein FZEAL_6427 [Fusarium zealandicum]
MDEIYQKIAEFNPHRPRNSPNANPFEVTELWRNDVTGIVEAHDLFITVPGVPSWLANEIRPLAAHGSESLVLRLVWANFDLNERRVELPESVQKPMIDNFGLRLAYNYFSSSVTGVTDFPKVVKPEADQQAYAFSYAPKLASIWSHTRFRPPSSRQCATHGIIMAEKKQKDSLKKLLKSRWQLATAAHAMFPAFLFSFLLHGEIDITQGGMIKHIQEVEARTGYSGFKTKRKYHATGELGTLSAEMSGYATRLASTERKSQTLGKLMDFVLRTIGSDNGTALDGDELMKHHIGVLQQRLSMQIMDREYTLKRVQIQIQALVNLITEHDSLNNFDIAISSHRDASSMKTLAFVTMFFLPGSFISALFSTDLFDWDSVKPGSIGVPSTPQFGLYWVITVPLTLITFILYFLWLHISIKRREEESERIRLDRGGMVDGVAGDLMLWHNVGCVVDSTQPDEPLMFGDLGLGTPDSRSVLTPRHDASCYYTALVEAYNYTGKPVMKYLSSFGVGPLPPPKQTTRTGRGLQLASLQCLLAHGTAKAAPSSIVPAQLGFLAIFNPSLGNTDDTIDDQIVYYASVTTQSASHKRRRTRGQPIQDISHDERNERLRQIGLAQGMASFSRGFASGAAVDAIDTEKSRVILHELEPGWWILASIDLTKLPLPPRLATKNSEPAEERFEYSSREMKPANLLLRDLLRAHSIFLMHHDSSLSALFVRTKRTKFIAVLSRYWDLYLSTWNVMMHGNPARDIFGGINVAASGELGVGVGEEDRGSGERDMLEGLVGRIEGLVDLVVSKFGDYDPDAPPTDGPTGESDQWLGTGKEPGPEDGAIFLGTGALSRKSLRDVTHWMGDLYTWGDHAYGIIESPTSVRRAKRIRARAAAQQVALDETPSTGAAETSKPVVAEPAVVENSPNDQPLPQDGEDGRLDKMVSYLKLGYGTYWSLPGGSGDYYAKDSPETATPQQDAKPEEQLLKPPRPSLSGRTSSYDAAGHYLIGLKGAIDQEYSDADSQSSDDAGNLEHNSRTVLRTVNIELESEASERPEATIVRDFVHPASALTQSQVVGNMVPGYDSHDLNKAKKLRVVVYVNRPFMFTFLFNLRTDSLALDTLYRSLHHQLAPLRTPLLSSTRYRPERPGADVGSSSGNAENSIYDLIWDPHSLTVHSSIPNIPDNYVEPEPWSRPDSLNTHLHILNLYAATRSRAMALERTEKSGRGWWIVWARLLDRQDEPSPSTNLSTIHEAGADGDPSSSHAVDQGSNDSSESLSREPDVAKEIFLIRRASDHVGFRTDASTGGGDGAGRLAHGIGVDTRRYVEELLNLL